MKRSSTLTIVIVALLPTIANAYYSYHVPVRYRTRYSPYAFSYKHPSGLIPGYLGYSPYAFGYRSSGLVPYWFRYSPYAFGYEHPSGLISDYWCGFYRYDDAGYEHDGVADCDSRSSGGAADREQPELLYYQMRQMHEENLTARDERIRKLKSDRPTVAANCNSDSGQIIRQYLSSKNIDFQINRILRIDNRMLSADFLLAGGNILIKYWNPDDIEYVTQASPYNKGVYDRYKQAWGKFSQEFERKGGRIYFIESANTQEVLNELNGCDGLNGG